VPDTGHERQAKACDRARERLVVESPEIL